MRLNGNRSGFTLIEILITVVILSIGIVAILRAFETSMVALTQARNALFGTVLCRDKLVDIESDTAVGKSPTGNSNGAFDGIYKDYRWNIESSPMPHKVKTNSSDTGSKKDEDVKIELYKVKVSVWRNGYPDEVQETETFLKF